VADTLGCGPVTLHIYIGCISTPGRWGRARGSDGVLGSVIFCMIAVVGLAVVAYRGKGSFSVSVADVVYFIGA